MPTPHLAQCRASVLVAGVDSSQAKRKPSTRTATVLCTSRPEGCKMHLLRCCRGSMTARATAPLSLGQRGHACTS
eukprot:365014-Chlamydomonas_euryale.AAC.12